MFSTASLVFVALEVSHHRIMRRLSGLNPTHADARLIKLLQRLPSTMVWQRVSPANAHYEMLASLDCFNAERFCRPARFRAAGHAARGSSTHVDLVLGLDLDSDHPQDQCARASPCRCSIRLAARLRFRSPSITICVLPDSPLAMARARSPTKAGTSAGPPEWPAKTRDAASAT